MTLNKTLLIAGTDVGVGKTLLLTALAHYGQTYYADRRIEIWPLAAAGDGATHPTASVSLTTGGAAMGVPVGLNCDRLWEQVSTLARDSDWLLLDGVGSLGTPLTWETTLADLAWDWRLPTLLVAAVTPGAIAQVVAQVALARQCRVHLRGIVLNCQTLEAMAQVDTWMPVALLQALTHLRVLGTLPYLPIPTDRDKLVQAAAALDLDRLLPW